MSRSKNKGERTRVVPDRVINRGEAVEKEIGCSECERPSASMVKVQGEWFLFFLSPHGRTKDGTHPNSISLKRLNRIASDADRLLKS